MHATGVIVARFPRCYGLPFQPGVPVVPARVALSSTAALELDRDTVLEVTGQFQLERTRNSTSVCQVDWRVEPIGSDPVSPDYFQGGVLPSGTAHFAAGVVAVPASFLLSPGLDPPRDSTARVVLENPLNCILDDSRAELPLTILAAPIVDEAVVGLDVPFSELDPELTGGGGGTGGYALGPNYTTNWTLQRANAAVGTITQESNGVVLQAGSSAAATDGDTFIFAKSAPPAGWRLSFLYTWLDGLTTTTGGGCFTRVGYYRGKGSGGIEADPNAWSAADAGDLGDVQMSSNGTGVRASINTQNSTISGASDQCRMRKYDGDGTTTAVAALGGEAFTFVAGKEYLIEVTREGSEMSFRKSAAGTTTESVAFNDPAIGALAGGGAWIFLAAVNGRRCRIREISLEPISAPPVGTLSYELQLTTNRTVPGTTGADLWPCTDAADGKTYATFGDGPGTGSVSIGLATITGGTVASLAAQFLVGGPSPSVKAKWDPVAGFSSADGALDAKATNLIAHGTSLYLWLADGTAGTRGWDDCRIGKVSLGNIGAGPAVPAWGMGTEHTWKTINPAWLQCGRDFADAWDGYVYAFPQHYAPQNNPADSPSHNPGRFYVIRCLRSADWQVQANWEWWTGGSDAAPSWGTYANRAPRIDLPGQIDWRPSAHYVGGAIDRCVFRVGTTGDPAFGGGSMSKFACLVAQRPWHAWTLVSNRQYLAAGVAADLAQVSAIPRTISISGKVATWVDTTWGGEDVDGLGGLSVTSDQLIATQSRLEVP